MNFKLFVALLLISLAIASAYPLPYQQSSDYYRVMFDAEGEASVLASLTRVNTGNGPISELVLEIPGESVRLRYAFQDGVCYSTMEQGITYEEQLLRKPMPPEYGCYQPGPLEYAKEQLSKSVRYTLKLNQPIEPGQAATVLLYYKATGYVNRLVNFDFDFETIKGSQDVDYLRVAIGADSELYLRGGAVRTDYRPALSGIESAASRADYAMVRPYFSDVRYASGLVREKRSLDPWESFHVYGKYNYADAWFLTYDWEILVGTAITAAAILLARKKIGILASILTNKKLAGQRRIALFGLLSAVLSLVSWWGLATVLPALGGSLLFTPLLILAGGGLMLAAFFAPAIYAGTKHGVNEGLLVLVSSALWLLAIAALLSALFQPESFARAYMD